MAGRQRMAFCSLLWKRHTLPSKGHPCLHNDSHHVSRAIAHSAHSTAFSTIATTPSLDLAPPMKPDA